jgi:hypothetical protein
VIRNDIPDVAEPKAKLKVDIGNSRIVLDDATSLSGIPPEAWDYKLGNRSALEWVLDQIAPAGVYPTPIYEMAMALIAFAILWSVRKHPFRAGWLPDPTSDSG